MNQSLQASKYALLAVAVVFVWQSCHVRFNYGGEWNALFLSGERFAIPASLAAEEIPQLADSDGYDGQFYHYIAHDPLMSKGLARYVDDPGLRWRRILVPGLAALLSAGHPSWVDTAYILVIYVFVGAGVRWLSLLAMRFQGHPAWGLCFVVIPATAISVERMTVDVAVTALTAGYAYYALNSRSGPTQFVLALAPLARETGLALLAAHAAYSLAARRWRELTATIVCGLPLFAWAVYVASMTSPSTSGWLSLGRLTRTIGLPFSGLITRSIAILPLPVTGSQALVAMLLDYAGIVGAWIALVQSVILLWPRLRPALVAHSRAMGPLEWGVAFFALSAVMLAVRKFGPVATPLPGCSRPGWSYCCSSPSETAAAGSPSLAF
jgi:hypothetical protein